MIKKNKFLELANCFSGPIETLTNYLLENPKSYSEDVAQKIIQITSTNSFHNGVCLETSRFNHACASNAEYFWNPNVNKRDVIAIK